MEYREHLPPGALRPFVSCIWTLRGSATPGPAQRVLPDGSVELVLHLGDRFQRHASDGTVHLQPAALVVGQVTRWLMLEAGREIDLVGVRFRAGLAGGVLGIPAAELLGGCHDLEAIQAPRLRGLVEEIGNLSDPHCRLPVLTRRLGEAARKTRPPREEVAQAFRCVEVAEGRLSISGLAERLGCSLRHLERVTRAEAGVTPKAYARIRRFQAVAARLRADRPPAWARLAAEAGYHDQPHLVREFREFAGTTPAAYWREVHPLGDLFLQPVEKLQDGPAQGR